MKTLFHHSSIQAIACCVPENLIKLEDQVDTLYKGDTKKMQRIQKTIGLNARYVANQMTTTLDLCFQASQKVLESTKLDSSLIDAIVFVTQTPNFLQPNNAHLLHGKLNLTQECACFDLNQGCSGFVYALFLASSLIESGAQHVLICAGDTLSKVVDPKDSNTAPIFGDAGSATLVSKEKGSSFFSLHSDGKGWENIVLPNSAFGIHCGFQKTPHDSRHLYMDGAEVFNFSIDKEPKAIHEILQFAQKEISEIDYIFFHQANAYIISNITRRLGLTLDKSPTQSIAKYGNTSSASIPLAICDYFWNTKLEADLQLILSGFGVGLSWATCLTTLKNHAMILEPFLLNQGAHK
ncbi:3-oxoacyl-ACP synthase [Helicobacter pametensis]|uniref:3-oxoacyl-ACP synthase n=1 Tax=Helicobacter pametensis TaxID=95149 RepID=UPI000489CC04|nr:3-oxoacyl-ACP synthase [Helicobacter pametensis]